MLRMNKLRNRYYLNTKDFMKASQSSQYHVISLIESLFNKNIGLQMFWELFVILLRFGMYKCYYILVVKHIQNSVK